MSLSSRIFIYPDCKINTKKSEIKTGQTLLSKVPGPDFGNNGLLFLNILKILAS
ncbi:MAG: hypothetical protein AMXMBFR49_10890 [Chlorobiota bacterium]